MKKLFAAFFPSEQSREKARLQAELARKNRIADVLESMIVSGRYTGNYMCHTLKHAYRDGVITEADLTITSNHVLACLNYDGTACGFVSAYLGYYYPYYRDTLNKSTMFVTHFERRIILSNYYWRMIRLLRGQRTPLTSLSMI